MNHLRNMPGLRMLDLSGNRLISVLPMDLSWLHLDRLVLERVGMHRWPSLVDRHDPQQHPRTVGGPQQPDGTARVDPRQSPSAEHRTVIDLRGNALSRHTAIHARINEAVAGSSFSFVMDTRLP